MTQPSGKIEYVGAWWLDRPMEPGKIPQIRPDNAWSSFRVFIDEKTPIEQGKEQIKGRIKEGRFGRATFEGMRYYDIFDGKYRVVEIELTKKYELDHSDSKAVKDPIHWKTELFKENRYGSTQYSFWGSWEKRDEQGRRTLAGGLLLEKPSSSHLLELLMRLDTARP